MMSIIEAIWSWIMSLFGAPLGPVKVGERVFMPLFLPYKMMTWNYLAMNDGARKSVRDYIRAQALYNETPAICFLLTPDDCNGGLVGNKMDMVTDIAKDELHRKCKELVKDGIAIFACLYNDDPTPAMPKWWEIEKHKNIWACLHGILKDYVSGYILSIESNEKADSKEHLEGCITFMRAVLPGAQFYGTHLQWQARGRYTWDRGNAPSNADCILMETRNDPNYDVPASSVLADYEAAQRANPIKICVHEYNINVNSSNQLTARAGIRKADAWGVA